MFKSFFEGWYFKHQNNLETVSIIPGVCDSNSFIQIITDSSSYNVNFPKNQIKNHESILVGNSIFSFNGITLNIETKDFSAKGEIKYQELTPLKKDIMGPFRFLPLECRHGVISMHHKIEGNLEINGKNFDFKNGIGYIEKDSGYSFPKRYVWTQSNDFDEKCSIMAAIAEIPFCGFHFQGIICVIYYKGHEYRIATYNGAKVIECSKEKIEISNQNLRLEIFISKYDGHELHAPVCGKMSNIVKEAPSCNVRFKLFESKELIFDLQSNKTSCEFVGY